MHANARFLAIDPGASTGWALYEGARPVLTLCGVCDPPGLQWGRIDRVLVEHPTKYPHDNVPPNNLITLAARMGRVIGPLEVAGAHIDYRKPADWKGQEPKPVCHGRSWVKLSAAEQEVVRKCASTVIKSFVPGAKVRDGHPLLDMLDAVALGQYAIAAGLWAAR